MDKGSLQKEDIGISPLTPCRPVGLRRKRSGVKNLHTPSSNSIKTNDLTSPISINSGLIKARVLTDQIASASLGEPCSTESDVTKELNNLGDNASKKRKSTTPLNKKVIRKMFHSNSASSSITDNDRLTKTCMQEKKSGVEINDSCTTKSKVDDVATRLETAISQSLLPVIPVITKQEEPTGIGIITDAKINTLREQIAAKEKKLKEFELAALYKKKHDFEQVAKEIECWLQGCKEALLTLQSELAKRNQTYSLHALLKKLGIPSSVLELDENSD